ncbi:MAG: hypothetical protein DMF81_02245 [Acidobacteria bacterium]|nr:MAG: hypothetical protein DMF81_02245 [Acidobacteriota bacterium]
MRPGPLSDPNPEQLPYVHIIKPAYYALDNRYGFGNGPVKDMISGTDPRYYTGYRGGQSPDFFDPNFESYVDGWMRGDDGLKYGNIGNPWMLGIAMDDTDDLFGFGPGPDVPAPRLHPHLGWIALVTSFEQSSSRWVTSYSDRAVYTKYALRDFLAARYGTISALNAAWGSTYTTFDSAGGGASTRPGATPGSAAGRTSSPPPRPPCAPTSETSCTSTQSATSRSWPPRCANTRRSTSSSGPPH